MFYVKINGVMNMLNSIFYESKFSIILFPDSINYRVGDYE